VHVQASHQPLRLHEDTRLGRAFDVANAYGLDKVVWVAATLLNSSTIGQPIALALQAFYDNVNTYRGNRAAWQELIVLVEGRMYNVRHALDVYEREGRDQQPVAAVQQVIEVWT
jgi:hypothetical protein